MTAKQKYPKSLAEAIKEIKELRQENKGIRDRLEIKAADFSNERHARQTAEKDAREARENFADLKERLANAESRNARLEGYMDRVREDDNVSDPLVEIEGPEGKRMVSKRHPSRQEHYRDYNDMDFINRAMGAEKRKHWTSY